MLVTQDRIASALRACGFSAMTLWACGGSSQPTGDGAGEGSSVLAAAEATTNWPRLSYAGRDSLGVPHYITRPFTSEERSLLARAFGVGDPGRLYLSDSTATAVVAWDLRADGGKEDLVYSFKVGLVSLRRPGESLAEFEERMQSTPGSAFPRSARVRDTALVLLDPTVRPLFEGLVAAARARGFDVRVAESYRSPARQGWLMSRADGRTFTATSLHAYGRAVDFVIGNGYGLTVENRREYVAFRRFALEYGRGRLKLLGTPMDTWDWGHVEAPASWLGYHTVEEALAAAQKCVGGQMGDAAEDPPPCVIPPRPGGAR
jgi:hypothetical protein